MSVDIECDVFLKDRDEDGLLSLRSAVWGVDHPHTNHAFMRWLFAATPSHDPIGVTVRVDKEMVGFVGLCRKRIWLDGRIEQVAHGVDYMIRPDLKGFAAGHTALMVARRWHQLTQELPFAVGLTFPNENSYPLLTSAFVGLKPIFWPALMVRPLSPIVLSNAIKSFPRRLGTTLLRLATLYGQTRAALTGIDGTLMPLSSFGTEYDELWVATAHHIRVGIVRDSAYLNWRYVHQPIYQYHRLSMRSGDRILGFVVGSPRETFNLNAMLLVDIIARAGDEMLSRSLINGLVRHAGLQGKDIVAALAIPGSALYSTLKQCGFLRVPSRMNPRPFCTAGVVLMDAAAAAWDPKAWYFTWGDIDVV